MATSADANSSAFRIRLDQSLLATGASHGTLPTDLPDAMRSGVALVGRRFCRPWAKASASAVGAGQPEVKAARRTSDFVGVYRMKLKWHSQIAAPDAGVKCYLGNFADEHCAAAIYDAAAFLLRGRGSQRNFPGKLPSRSDLEFAADRIAATTAKQRNTYRGARCRGSRWISQIRHEGKTFHLGSFATQIQAAEAFDQAQRTRVTAPSGLLRSLNFPLESDYFDMSTWQAVAVPEGKTSRFLGVSRRSDGLFVAFVRCKFIGRFHSEVAAAQAFDEASLVGGGRTNFHPSNYSRLPTWSMKNIPEADGLITAFMLGLLEGLTCVGFLFFVGVLVIQRGS